MNGAYKIIENIKLSDINAFPVSSRTFCDSPRFPGEKKKVFNGSPEFVETLLLCC